MCVCVVCLPICAHVAFNSETTFEMQVVLGGVDIQKNEAIDQTVGVEDYITHENYEDIDNVLYNDIGHLLKYFDT